MRDFTESVAMEAVRILDLLCLMDPPLITRIFPAVKKVRARARAADDLLAIVARPRRAG